MEEESRSHFVAEVEIDNYSPVHLQSLDLVDTSFSYSPHSQSMEQCFSPFHRGRQATK